MKITRSGFVVHERRSLIMGNQVNALKSICFCRSVLLKLFLSFSGPRMERNFLPAIIQRAEIVAHSAEKPQIVDKTPWVVEVALRTGDFENNLWNNLKGSHDTEDHQLLTELLRFLGLTGSPIFCKTLGSVKFRNSRIITSHWGQLRKTRINDH